MKHKIPHLYPVYFFHLTEMSPNRSEEQTREQIANVLKTLSDEEQVLLTKILEVERAKIHVGNPHIYEDLCKAVVGSIKA